MRWFFALLLAAGAYGVGFALFVMLLPMPQVLLPDPPEGLVVFTGGSGRVDAAVELLRRGFHGPVLIVHEDVKLTELIPPDVLRAVPSRNLTLDYAARTTRENVLNTAVWAANHHITRLAVVTNQFHALRCRVMFMLLAPQLQPTMLVVGSDMNWRGLLREYHKLLGSPFWM
jgi:uncharacterized SAM-binding protein YcdF (DUF218 family)